MNLELRYKREWTRACVAGLGLYWSAVFLVNASPLRAVAVFAGTTIAIYSCLSIRRFWKECVLDDIAWHTYQDQEKK